MLDGEKGKLELDYSRYPFWQWHGKEKDFADLEDDETEEEFESGEELEEEEEGWGEHEFVSDDSDLEGSENGDDWDLEDMGLERASDDTEAVRLGVLLYCLVELTQLCLGWR